MDAAKTIILTHETHGEVEVGLHQYESAGEHDWTEKWCDENGWEPTEDDDEGEPAEPELDANGQPIAPAVDAPKKKGKGKGRGKGKA